MKKCILCYILAFLFFTHSSMAKLPNTMRPEITTEQLQAQAKKENPTRVHFAKNHNVTTVPSPDGKSFFLLWYPPNHQKGKIPVIVTFSGHGSYAYDEFFLWQPMAEKHGFGIIAVQWWLGQGEKLNDYYLMRQIYPPLEQLLKSEGVKPGSVLAHGFSRGAANIYSLAYLDKISGNHFFGATLANAGKIQHSFPENRPLFDSGKNIFANTRWFLYCGEHDPHPNRDGCPGMNETKNWLKEHGAIIDLFIEDKNGDHGGFHRNPQNIEKALTTFQKIITR